MFFLDKCIRKCTMRYVEDIKQVAGSQRNKMTQQHVNLDCPSSETKINQRLNLMDNNIGRQCSSTNHNPTKSWGCST